MIPSRSASHWLFRGNTSNDSRFTEQGTHPTHSLRDLDRGEGAALHAHLFEEAIDWAEPIRKHTRSIPRLRHQHHLNVPFYM
jgi:hypothetical protein